MEYVEDNTVVVFWAFVLVIPIVRVVGVHFGFVKVSEVYIFVNLFSVSNCQLERLKNLCEILNEFTIA